ncbi:MAG: metallophosphoesterase [Clostridia bacterium]|jgi:Icc-related predicted phosphoesterase|nr:metallophosphoesterase [Spirochaetia bacterium]
MKILCISDKVDPLIYSNGVKERFADIDLVLSAGDLPMEYLSFIVSILNRPLLFVFGNHNLTDLPYYRPSSASHPYPIHSYERDSGASYVGFKLKKESGLLILGLGGSILYNNGGNQFSQQQMWLRVLAKIPVLFFNKLRYGRYVDIVLTHAPPKGIHDRDDPCHRGFEAFLWLMRYFKPQFLIHGHIHLYDNREERRTQYCDTLVINAFGYQVLDIGANHERTL